MKLSTFLVYFYSWRHNLFYRFKVYLSNNWHARTNSLEAPIVKEYFDYWNIIQSVTDYSTRQTKPKWSTLRKNFSAYEISKINLLLKHLRTLLVYSSTGFSHEKYVDSVSWPRKKLSILTYQAHNKKICVTNPVASRQWLIFQ